MTSPTTAEELEAAAARVIALIADCANEVGWQAGEPGQEIAGGIVGYLAAFPDRIPGFLANPTSLLVPDDPKDMADFHTGCLTWRTRTGEIIGREEYERRAAALQAAGGGE